MIRYLVLLVALVACGSEDKDEQQQTQHVQVVIAKDVHKPAKQDNEDKPKGNNSFKPSKPPVPRFPSPPPMATGCTVTQDENTATITCEDGSEAVIELPEVEDCEVPDAT